MDWTRRLIGRGLARFLACPREGVGFGPTSPAELLVATVRRGDVLLVEGTRRFSEAIKYLTQSTWSHAALCVGDATLVEVDISEGVRRVPITEYDRYHTRICRAAGLTDSEIDAVVDYVEERIGHQYDLKNIVDLARYLVPTPPVPARWRSRMLTLGSGELTRAICSSLIAQAFQSVGYPILPHIEERPAPGGALEVLHVRHNSLFTPRDFDVAPFFEIIKPRLQDGFDPHQLVWRNSSGNRPIALSGVPIDVHEFPDLVVETVGARYLLGVDVGL